LVLLKELRYRSDGALGEQANHPGPAHRLDSQLSDSVGDSVTIRANLISDLPAAQDDHLCISKKLNSVVLPKL
jgi:hypothetical protein